ncbi:H-2 class I histocompatibility antigen, Q10 alpha chain-like [Arvicola amphibius]|uniref:H-2 class I histocompatibility antigen, Q10 alpha chain-like n=1 Tax=Arvicola amphibius TaxID=1047088 RepID=UPI0018E3EBAA|nr:H-2 class I histocompatibility antigen, Q10 alpha chain-like [Arvicola amphibius]XP_038197359.1 H-2 class I histocompatibility antigen, Q10 alpha chain-like [Arvicola amphibius]
MGATVPPALVLMLGAPLFCAQTHAGSHSLLYFRTTVFRPGLGEPRFIFVGYVDYTEFLRYDSDAETPRMEPRAPWMEQEGPENWDLQTEKARTQAQLSGGNLMILLRYFNQSEDDPHTLQGMRGCEVGTDGRLLRWYDQMAYDGVDCLTQNEDLSSGTVTSSTLTHISLDSLGTHLKGKCVKLLQKHLEKGKDTLLRSEPPKAHVAHHQILKRVTFVTLRCWALGFYPAEISLTWQLDGEELIQEMEFVETRPTGDGTFQKWAAVVVPSGEEHKYTCHVLHEGLPEPLTLRWEATSYKKIISIIAGLFVGLIIIGALMCCICKKKDAGWRRRIHPQKAGRDSHQDSGETVVDYEVIAVPRGRLSPARVIEATSSDL